MPIPGMSLVGFLEEQPAMMYLTQACIPADPAPSAIRQEWLDAQSKINSANLTIKEPDIQNIPIQHNSYLQQVVRNPRFDETVQGLKWRFAQVEIAPIIAYQLHVETTRLRDMESTLGQKPTMTNRLSLCLPVNLEDIPFQWSGTANSLIIRANDPNLRILLAGQIGGDAAKQISIAGIGLGAGSPLVQVVHYNGRYYLRNGFHRMFELQQRGVSHLPCLLLEGSDFSHVGAIGGGLTFAQALLESAAPPMCGHYTHAHAVQIRKMTRIISVSWSEHALAEEM